MARHRQHPDWEQQLASIIEKSNKNLTHVKFEYNKIKQNTPTYASSALHPPPPPAPAQSQSRARSYTNLAEPRRVKEKAEGTHERPALHSFNSAIIRPLTASAEDDIMRRVEIRMRQCVERQLHEKLTSTALAIDSLRDQLCAVADDFRELNNQTSRVTRSIASQERRIDVLSHDVDSKSCAINNVEAHLNDEISRIKQFVAQSLEKDLSTKVSHQQVKSAIESSELNMKMSIASIERNVTGKLNNIGTELSKSLQGLANEETSKVEQRCLGILKSNMERFVTTVNQNYDAQASKQRQEMVDTVTRIVALSVTEVEKSLTKQLKQRIEVNVEELKNQLANTPSASNEEVKSLKQTIATMRNELAIVKAELEQSRSNDQNLSDTMTKVKERVNSLHTSYERNDADIASLFESLAHQEAMVQGLKEEHDEVTVSIGDLVTSDEVALVVEHAFEERFESLDVHVEDQVNALKFELEAAQRELTRNYINNLADIEAKLATLELNPRNSNSDENYVTKDEVQIIVEQAVDERYDIFNDLEVVNKTCSSNLANMDTRLATLQSFSESTGIELKTVQSQLTGMDATFESLSKSVTACIDSVRELEARVDEIEGDTKHRPISMLDVIESFEQRVETSCLRGEILVLRNKLDLSEQQQAKISSDTSSHDESFQLVSDRLGQAITKLHTTLIDARELGGATRESSVPALPVVDSHQHTAVDAKYTLRNDTAQLQLISEDQPASQQPPAEIKSPFPNQNMLNETLTSPCIHLMGLSSPGSVTTTDTLSIRKRSPVPSPRPIPPVADEVNASQLSAIICEDVTSPSKEDDALATQIDVVRLNESVANDSALYEAITPRSNSSLTAIGSIQTADAPSFCGDSPVPGLRSLTYSNSGSNDIGEDQQNAKLLLSNAGEDHNQTHETDELIEYLQHIADECDLSTDNSALSNGASPESIQSCRLDDNSSIPGSITSFDEIEHISTGSRNFNPRSALDISPYEAWEQVLEELRGTGRIAYATDNVPAGTQKKEVEVNNATLNESSVSYSSFESEE